MINSHLKTLAKLLKIIGINKLKLKKNMEVYQIVGLSCMNIYYSEPIVYRSKEKALKRLEDLKQLNTYKYLTIETLYIY